MFRKCYSRHTYFNFKRSLSFKKPDKIDCPKHKQILMEPFEYIQKVPSKYYALMAPCFNDWLQVPDQKLAAIEEAMRTMATWFILADDIQDSSAFRYGAPSANNKFGVGLTFNAAINALLLGQKQIMDLGHPLGQKILLKILDENFYGQGIDIYWGDNFICPTEEMHIEMVKKKCGSLFSLPVQLLELFSNKKSDYSGLAYDIGTYYHIVDDYFNLFQPKALETLGSIKQDNHQNVSDITESKITLAIIHALQFPDVADELTDILKQRTSDPKLKNRVISLLKKHGSDKYAKNKLKTMEADIRYQIKQHGGNAKLTAFIDDLSIY